jgi:PAS domain S-box-containing protein
MRQLFRESRRWGVRYRSLLSGISVGVIVSAPDGQILRPHPAIEPLLGMKWPEYKGFGWIAGVHPDDLKIDINEPGVRGNVLRRTVRLRDPATGDWRWYQFRSVPLVDADGKPEELVSVLIDVHQRKLGEQQSELVTGEMRHRWKNLMAVITALAQSSQPEGDKAVASYVEKFLGRLQAIQAAGDIAILEHRSIDVGGVVRATLVPFIEEGSRRILTKGPRVALSEQTGSALALAIHELATNAIKYGALSVPEGMVSVEWQRSDLGNAEQISIEWIEAGGPPVTKPDRESFGTRVVRFVAAREKSGNVDLDFREEGLCCRISFLREKRMQSDELAL